MKIKVRYRNNRLDVFDTDSFTKSEPFPGTNMLSNFEVQLELLGGTGLWLSAHHYDAAQTLADQECGETPVARRKRGWRFLLAEASEVEEVESVCIDQELVLQRMCGELVDVLRLNEVAKLWVTDSESMCTAEKILELFDVLPREEEGMDGEAVARRCGCSFTLVKALQAMRQSDEASDELAEDEDNWMEGMDHEDAY